MKTKVNLVKLYKAGGLVREGFRVYEAAEFYSYRKKCFVYFVFVFVSFAILPFF